MHTGRRIWYDFEVSANLRHLAKAAGTVVPVDKYPSRDVVSSVSISIGEIYGTLTASDKSAQLELRCLTIKQAEDILSYLKGGK
jgi:hypothetical protein